MTGCHRGPKQKLRAGYRVLSLQHTSHAVTRFYRRVWYHALSLHYVCIRRPGIILAPGYLCAKFRFFCNFHCWASPWRRNCIFNQSLAQLIWCPRNRSFCFRIIIIIMWFIKRQCVKGLQWHWYSSCCNDDLPKQWRHFQSSPRRPRLSPPPTVQCGTRCGTEECRVLCERSYAPNVCWSDGTWDQATASHNPTVSISHFTVQYHQLRSAMAGTLVKLA